MKEGNRTQVNAGQVRRSLRTFRDLAGDLLRADWQMFGDGLNQFVSFCRTDTVFPAIHEQLVHNAGIDAQEWLNENRHIRLSGLRFPLDPDERLSLQYQLVIGGADHPSALIKQAAEWFHRPGGRLSD